MSDSTPLSAELKPGDVYWYFALACGITWSLDLPVALAWGRHLEPPSYALPLTGLGALGPTLAALLVAGRRHALRSVFGRWRTQPAWILIALLIPLALHLPATMTEVALGGQPAHWFYPPVKPEHFAALVMFSFGEEFGWRGLAYPQLAQRHGPVLGALMVGTVWGVWHFGMKFTPEHGAPDPLEFVEFVAELAVYSIVAAWVFERGNFSMAVAVAFHAGGHLDNIYRAPETEVRLRALRFAVLAVAAVLAGRSLTGRRERVATPTTATG